jgi:hypothetical protein
MKKLVSLVLFLFLFGVCSCASLNVISDKRPAGCEESIIYAKIPNPKTAGIAVELANITFVKHYPLAKASVLSSLGKVETLLNNDPVTWKELITMVTGEVNSIKNNFGIELLILSGYLKVLDNPLPINKCDKDLLLNHVKEQKMYINML